MTNEHNEQLNNTVPFDDEAPAQEQEAGGESGDDETNQEAATSDEGGASASPQPDDGNETEEELGEDPAQYAETTSVQYQAEPDPEPAQERNEEQPQNTSQRVVQDQQQAMQQRQGNVDPYRKPENVRFELEYSGDPGVFFERRFNKMKEHLQQQPRVHFMIPLSSGEQQGAYETVTINGYRVVIKKGVMVQIPQQVAQILGEHYEITQNVGREYEIDRREDTFSALS
jgi:hypothetical protein